mmetsp:Transcript_84913/g.253109  ORF Transcript_84913/g.253109 Transcript_84913/m.253109 type:complete len:248 (+) Transcript_84913:2027-2770(+)
MIGQVLPVEPSPRASCMVPATITTSNSSATDCSSRTAGCEALHRPGSTMAPSGSTRSLGRSAGGWRRRMPSSVCRHAFAGCGISATAAARRTPPASTIAGSEQGPNGGAGPGGTSICASSGLDGAGNLVCLTSRASLAARNSAREGPPAGGGGGAGDPLPAFPLPFPFAWLEELPCSPPGGTGSAAPPASWDGCSGSCPVAEVGADCAVAWPAGSSSGTSGNDSCESLLAVVEGVESPPSPLSLRAA